ncbi:hypothetical protein ONZ45_g10535 [Pleurotus djamor]|nr:hypothetical protein ONZ45_g13064 [Pleurotus djamor]KAJ8507055.1 hypothetical protein ONZ45_g10535 [Pleurotus djamor]
MTGVSKTSQDALVALLGSDVRLDDTPEDQRKPVTLSERLLPRAYSNKLTPPAGTDYWRRQTFNVLTDQQLIYHSHVPPFPDQDILVETLTWNIDAYVYTVNARPGDNFSEQGGAIYIVIVNSGSAATGSLVGGGMEYRYNVNMKSPPSGSTTVKQLPPSNTGTTSGDNTNYPISFAQDMQMFKNSGNEVFTFPAQYEDSIDLRKGDQVGFVNGPHGTQWGIVFENYPEFYWNFPFGSVSVFSVPSPQQVTFECVASVYSQRSSEGSQMASETRTITVDCRF